MIDPKTLRVIDIDFIRELRRSGDSYTANRLLEAYYKDIKNQKKYALSDFMKHKRSVLKTKGYCTSCEKRKAKKWNLCSSCFKSKKKSGSRTNECSGGNLKQVYRKSCKKCGWKRTGEALRKNAFYKRVTFLNNLKKGETYNSKELSILLHYQELSESFYIFIKKIIDMKIIKKERKRYSLT